MIDVLETNKLPSAAAGISVEARQTAGEPTAESCRLHSFHHMCLHHDKVFICGLLLNTFLLCAPYGISDWMRH